MEIPETKKIQVSVKGRSAGPYTVTFSSSFTLRGEELSIGCSCSAGQRGQSCEHVYGVVLGDEAILIEPADRKKLPEIARLVSRFNLLPTLNELNVELAKVEKAMEELRRKKQAIQKKIALAITRGTTPPSA
jgi:hypothetical protein